MTTSVGEIDFLGQVYDILKSLERDSTDATGKRMEESSQKIIEFNKKLDGVREQISSLPGIEYSREAQLRKFEGLQEQLRLKQKLLQKYKDMVTLEGGNLKQYLG